MRKPSLRADVRSWFAVAVADVLTFLLCVVTVLPTLYRARRLLAVLQACLFSISRSMPTANAEVPCRSEGA